MRRVLVFLTGVTLFAATGCKRTGDVYETKKIELETTKITRVEIDWEIGEITVEQSANGKLYANEENGKDILYQCEEETLKITHSPSAKKRNAQTAALQVEIPQDLRLEIDGGNSGVTLGILTLQDLSVETDAGNISAEKIICRKAEFETESGGVYIGDIEGGNIEAETENGELKIGVSKPLRLNVSAKNKDVYLFLGADIGARVRFQTTGGNLKGSRTFTKKDGYYDYAGKQLCRVSVRTEKGNLVVE